MKKVRRLLALTLSVILVMGAMFAMVPVVYAQTQETYVAGFSLGASEVDVTASYVIVPLKLDLECGSGVAGITKIDFAMQGTGDNRIEYVEDFDVPRNGKTTVDLRIEKGIPMDTYRLESFSVEYADEQGTHVSDVTYDSSVDAYYAGGYLIRSGLVTLNVISYSDGIQHLESWITEFHLGANYVDTTNGSAAIPASIVLARGSEAQGFTEVVFTFESVNGTGNRFEYKEEFGEAIKEGQIPINIEIGQDIPVDNYALTSVHVARKENDGFVISMVRYEVQNDCYYSEGISMRYGQVYLDVYATPVEETHVTAFAFAQTSVDVSNVDTSVPMSITLQGDEKAQGITVVAVALQGTGDNILEYEEHYDVPIKSGTVTLNIPVSKNTPKDTYSLYSFYVGYGTSYVSDVFYEEGENAYISEGKVIYRGAMIQLDVQSNATDKTAPVIKAVTIDSDSYSTSETMLIHLEIEEKSDLQNIEFVFSDAETWNEYYPVDANKFYRGENDGEWIAEVELKPFKDAFILPQRLIIVAVNVTDAGGCTGYGGAYENCIFTLTPAGQIYITDFGVGGSESVDVTNETGVIPLTFQLAGDESANGFTQIYVEWMGSADNFIRFQREYAEPLKAGEVTVNVPISKTTPQDTYWLNTIRLGYWEGHECIECFIDYNHEMDCYIVNGAVVNGEGRITRNVISAVTDNIAPILTSIAVEKEDYATSENKMNILFEAMDDADIGNIMVMFHDGTNEYGFGADNLSYDEAKGKWVAEFGFGPFSDLSELPASFSVTCVDIQDVYGNERHYWLDDKSEEPMLTDGTDDLISVADCNFTLTQSTGSAGNHAFVTGFELSTHEADLSQGPAKASIKINVNYGNSSGITMVHVAFTPSTYAEGKSNAIHVVHEVNPAQTSGIIEFEFTIPEDIANDTYYLDMISIGDFFADLDGGHGFPTEDSWNTDTIGGYDYFKGVYAYDVQNSGIVVEGSAFEVEDASMVVTGSKNNDTMVPRIRSVHMERTEYDLPDQLTITMDIEEESDIQAVHMMIFNGHKYIDLYTEENIQKIGDSVWEASFDLNEQQIPAGEYEIVALEVWDAWRYNVYYEQISQEDAWMGEVTAPGELAATRGASSKWRIDVSACNMTIRNENELDQIAPKITNVTIRDDSIQSPDLVYLDVDFIEENGLDGAGAVWVCGATQEWIEYSLPGEMLSELVTGEGENKRVTLILSMSQYRPEGLYTLHRIDLWDEAGNFAGIYADDNRVAYGYEHTCMPELTERGNFVITNSTNFDEKLVSVRSDIVQKIAESPDDANILITIPNVGHAEEVVDEAWLRAIMGTNRTLTVVNKNGVQWIWEGSDIKNNGDVKDLDVSVQIELVDGGPWGYRNYIQKVVFGNNGRLPGDPQVRIPVEFYFWKAGLDEVFFDMLYVNGDDLEEVEGDIPIENDAFVEVDMKHNSTYLLVPNDAERIEDTDDGNSNGGPNDGNSNDGPNNGGSNDGGTGDGGIGDGSGTGSGSGTGTDSGDGADKDSHQNADKDNPKTGDSLFWIFTEVALLGISAAGMFASSKKRRKLLTK